MVENTYAINIFTIKYVQFRCNHVFGKMHMILQNFFKLRRYLFVTYYVSNYKIVEINIS